MQLHPSNLTDRAESLRACHHARACLGARNADAAPFHAMRPAPAGPGGRPWPALAPHRAPAGCRSGATGTEPGGAATREPSGRPAEAADAVRHERLASARSSLAEELGSGRTLLLQARVMTTRLVCEARAGGAFDAARCEPMLDALIDSLLRHPEALPALVRSKRGEDDLRSMHAVAVCVLMLALAITLGFDRERCRQAGLAGLLHEFDAELTDGASPPAARDRHCPVAPDTHLQMLSICDAYDDLTSGSRELAACDPAVAVELLCLHRGEAERWLRESLVATVGCYPVGSLVRLRSGRLGVVMENRPARWLQPKVRVFYSATRMHALAPEVVDLAVIPFADRLDGREPRFGWSFEDLGSLWLP